MDQEHSRCAAANPRSGCYLRFFSLSSSTFDSFCFDFLFLCFSILSFDRFCFDFLFLCFLRFALGWFLCFGSSYSYLVVLASDVWRRNDGRKFRGNEQWFRQPLCPISMAMEVLRCSESDSSALQISWEGRLAFPRWSLSSSLKNISFNLSPFPSFFLIC